MGSLQSYKMEPLIVFSFSRRECEAYSLACANPDMGNLCFATQDEAASIEEVHCSKSLLTLVFLCHAYQLLFTCAGLVAVRSMWFKLIQWIDVCLLHQYAPLPACTANVLPPCADQAYNNMLNATDSCTASVLPLC